MLTAGRGPFASFPEITWDHSQHAAAAAELHAQRIERVDPFGARLLVLLYGLAINTVFRIVRDECLSGSALMRPAAMVQLLDEWAAPTAIRIAEKWQLPSALIQALTEPRAEGLARSLRFGRLAGALLLLTNRGHMRELSARAIVLADDVRRAQVDRLWTRLATAFLVATR